MSERSIASLPWAGILVAATFIAGSVLTPTVLDRLRPAENERVPLADGFDLDVDARLWEDPFVAMRRSESERVEGCRKLDDEESKESPSCSASLLTQRRSPELLIKNLNEKGKGEHAETLVIAALVPGNPFVGAQEYRRRTRYAMVSGLQSMGYLPDDPEKLGILSFDYSLGAAKGRQRLDVPYEVFSERPQLRGDQAPRPGNGKSWTRMALLWIDEAALAVPKLDQFARVVRLLLGAPNAEFQPQLVVIGPSSSDALRRALADLTHASERTLEDEVKDGYRYLLDAELLSAAATAPNNALKELNGQRLEQFVSERLWRAAGKPGEMPEKSNFHRTIAHDNTTLRALIAELKRRLTPDAKRRIVLVAERDSLYAQALVSELRYRLDEPNLEFEVSYYLRGVDGVTTRDGDGKEAAPAGERKGASPVEWPERRDQLDYLRRLAATLHASEAASDKGPIGAIGILGSDVYDKLMVIHALRDSFPDKVFFTTDMDARYVHPRSVLFTRNLIVASSLPLTMTDPTQPGAGTLMRDVYQSATYLAARRAACREDACRKAEDAARKEILDKPSVYEIGRSRPVPLVGHAAEVRGLPQSTLPRTTVAILLVSLLGFALFVWPSTPALRDARERLRPTAERQGTVGLSTALLVAIHCALLVYTIGSTLEFINPGRSNLSGLLFAAGLSSLLALAVLYPRRSRLETASEPNTLTTGSCLSPLRPLLAAVVVAIGLTVWLTWPRPDLQPCTDCEPAAWLEGISAWPSHLIHLLALIATAWSLDWLWSEVRCSIKGDVDWLAVKPKAQLGGGGGERRRGLCAWVETNSLAFWKRSPGGEGVHFESLWQQYDQRARATSRATRIAFWYLCTVGAAMAMFLVFSEGYIPEVPVRGIEHRRLVAWTLYALLLLLPLLMVAVADATMLTCGLIWKMNGASDDPPERQRTAYPPDTVARFASSLGPNHIHHWDTPIAAEPWLRNDLDAKPGSSNHTLLDDWIDVQFVARRTQAVGRLIIGPFVVLALLVVARSRLFDNWALTFPVLLSIGAYLLWLIVLAAMLKQAGEQSRRRALLRMNADLRWLAGSARRELAEPFQRLIDGVERERRGAFAPILEQPLFTALLVPLGGASGAQLFDMLLMAR